MEKVFKTQSCDLQYMFFPNKKSDELLIVFSGFGHPGEAAHYNYVRSFQKVKKNKLYILDNFSFDKCGAYYLGKDYDFFIEDAVQRLISRLASKHNIKNEDIITCGSSKGGTAALMFGLKYGYGEILAGAPQIYIGDYLIGSGREETARYIVGEALDIEGLNNILFDIVKGHDNKQQPLIKIHVGSGDHHLKNHIKPFIECLDDKKLK